MAKSASFEKKGKVSLWLGIRKPDLPKMRNIDILKKLCGVTDYNLDDQEVAGVDDSFPLAKIKDLIAKFSYSSSFIDAALKAAEKQSLTQAYWCLAQFDFAYDTKKASGKVAPDPIFLGVFDWND